MQVSNIEIQVVDQIVPSVDQTEVEAASSPVRFTELHFAGGGVVFTW